MAQNPLKLKELGERSTRRSLLDSWYGSDYAAVEMAAQGGLTTLGDSIDALSEKLFSAETRRTMQLKREWPAIAGEQLAVLAGFGGFAEGVLALEVRLHHQKWGSAPQSMDEPITTEYAQNCQMYDFIAGLADLLSGGTAQQKEYEIAYLTEGGVLDRYEALLQKEVIEYADIF